MTEAGQCGRCGAELSADASPHGLCARCLLEAGLTSSEAAADSRQETSPAEASTTGRGPLQVAELARFFPQLEIQRLLGRGGMGAVYLARQKALDRPVALKLLAPRGGTGPEFAERFDREAKALARLNHSGIVAVYDSGVVEGQYFFLMEFVDGTSLRDVMRQGRLAPSQALALVPQICDALQYAHDKGVVHRDIKPENILLDKKGRIKIADFGLAKIVGTESSESGLTGSRHVMGTPHYMAPEQLEHPKWVDHRADIYSLGVVFYEMLTGELPLGRFATPSQKVHVDVRLDEIVLRALEKEPERRYQHASEVKTEVEKIDASAAPADQTTGEYAWEGTLRRYFKVANIPLFLFLLAASWTVFLLKLKLGQLLHLFIEPLLFGIPLVIAIWKRGTAVGTYALVQLQALCLFYCLFSFLVGSLFYSGRSLTLSILLFVTLIGVWIWIGETWKGWGMEWPETVPAPFFGKVYRFAAESYMRVEWLLRRGNR